MKRIYYISAISFLLAIGCSTSKQQISRSSSDISEPMHSYGKPIKAYYCGKSCIRIGQSKEQVIEEIKSSEHKHMGNTLKIKMPRSTESDKWHLMSGKGGGAVPGSTELILTFEQNQLVSMRSCPLP